MYCCRPGHGQRRNDEKTGWGTNVLHPGNPDAPRKNDQYGNPPLADTSWPLYVPDADVNDDPNDNDLDDPVLLNLAIPGDIVSITGHLVMINKIRFQNNSRVSAYILMDIIESTTWQDDWMVQNSQTVNNYNNSIISIRRLIPVN